MTCPILRPIICLALKNIVQRKQFKQNYPRIIAISFFTPSFLSVMVIEHAPTPCCAFLAPLKHPNLTLNFIGAFLRYLRLCGTLRYFIFGTTFNVISFGKFHKYRIKNPSIVTNLKNSLVLLSSWLVDSCFLKISPL